MKHLDRSRYDRERHQRKQNDWLAEVDDGDRVGLIVIISSAEARVCELREATASDLRHRPRADVAARTRSVRISLGRKFRKQNTKGKKTKQGCCVGTHGTYGNQPVCKMTTMAKRLTAGRRRGRHQIHQTMLIDCGSRGKPCLIIKTRPRWPKRDQTRRIHEQKGGGRWIKGVS